MRCSKLEWQVPHSAIQLREPRAKTSIELITKDTQLCKKINAVTDWGHGYSFPKKAGKREKNVGYTFLPFSHIWYFFSICGFCTISLPQATGLYHLLVAGVSKNVFGDLMSSECETLDAHLCLCICLNLSIEQTCLVNCFLMSPHNIILIFEWNRLKQSLVILELK